MGSFNWILCYAQNDKNLMPLGSFMDFIEVLLNSDCAVKDRNRMRLVP
jgi:hypothetical protein